MALIELLGQNGGGSIPTPQPPVTITCDWESLPQNERFESIASLIEQARFAAGIVAAKEAYVIITGVLDDRTAQEFRNCVLDAYHSRSLNKTQDTSYENE